MAANSASDANHFENKAALLDALPECIFMIGQDHNVLTVNSSVEAMLGTDATSIVGESLRSVVSPLTNGEGKPLDIDTPVDRCFNTGEAELLDAWLKVPTDGLANSDKELSKISVTVLPIAGRDGSSRVAVVIDGTAIRQPYALRDAVLSMVSHELRTPLLHIKGFVSTLLESDIQWDEETRLDFLHTIDREADRLTSMVSDLMEITRMGSVDLPLHLEDADPYLLAYAAIDSASMFIRKHRVLVEVPEDLPKVEMDVLRVMGVLANLLQNSSKYSEVGTKIIIDAETDDKSVTFSVKDEGNGISEDARDRIFGMFYRGEESSRSSPGSGLGLAVCKSVVDAHGGKIWVESEVGEGATFKFTMPLKQARKNAPVPTMTRRSASSKKTKKAADTHKTSESSAKPGSTRSSTAQQRGSKRASATLPTGKTKSTKSNRKAVAAR